MLSTAGRRVWLYTQPVDMRKGFDGLAGIVTQHRLDLFSGDLFAFLSRHRNRAKVLAWDRGGLALYYKRLEQGRFFRIYAQPGATHVQLDGVQLAMLLDGVDVEAVRRTKVWSPTLPGLAS